MNKKSIEASKEVARIAKICKKNRKNARSRFAPTARPGQQDLRRKNPFLPYAMMFFHPAREGACAPAPNDLRGPAVPVPRHGGAYSATRMPGSGPRAGSKRRPGGTGFIAYASDVKNYAFGFIPSAPALRLCLL